MCVLHTDYINCYSMCKILLTWPCLKELFIGWDLGQEN